MFRIAAESQTNGFISDSVFRFTEIVKYDIKGITFHCSCDKHGSIFNGCFVSRQRNILAFNEVNDGTLVLLMMDN